MPTYHYRCADCGHSFDTFQKFSEDTLTECPACSGPIRRVPQAVGIVFKGSGWYVNDSRDSKDKSSKAADTPAKTESPAEAKTGTPGETPKTEPKKAPAAAAVES